MIEAFMIAEKATYIPHDSSKTTFWGPLQIGAE